MTRYYTEHGDTNIQQLFLPQRRGGWKQVPDMVPFRRIHQFTRNMVTLKKVSSGYRFCPMKSYGIIMDTVRQMRQNQRQKHSIISYRLINGDLRKAPQAVSCGGISCGLRSACL